MPIARGARKDVPKSVSPLPRAPVVAPSPPPRFVTGSIARHILVMTGTGAVGLMAIFVSDFATLFFLDLLGDLQLLAAVGYAGAIMFIMFSAGLGMAIAVASLVSPALGAGDFCSRLPTVHACGGLHGRRRDVAGGRAVADVADGY
jgi:MatE